MTIPNQLQEMRDLIVNQQKIASVFQTNAKSLSKTLSKIAERCADYVEICPSKTPAYEVKQVAQLITFLQDKLSIGLLYDDLITALKLLLQHTDKMIDQARQIIVHGGDNVVAFKRPLPACFLPINGGDAA